MSGYDVVIRFYIVASADAVESMRSSTLPCAKKRVRESDLVVFSKYQRASAVIFCPSRPSAPSTLPSSHPSSLFPVHAFACISANRHFLVIYVQPRVPTPYNVPLSVCVEVGSRRSIYDKKRLLVQILRSVRK